MTNRDQEMELKPCPFCGSTPNPVPQNDDCQIPAHLVQAGGPKYYQTIWCENCGAEGGKRVLEAEAIAAWNRRASEAQTADLKAEVVRLREGLEGAHAKARVAEDLMRSLGQWENAAGYLTDAALWLDRAMTEARSALLLKGEGLEGDSARTNLEFDGPRTASDGARQSEGGAS